MTHSKGIRRNTRYLFAKKHKKHGTEHLSTYMHVYKRGQYVDIKGNGAIHKGMPFRYFHGKTGKIFDVTRRAVGVIVNKQVKGRIIPKRMHVRIEHVHPSKCNQDHLERKKLRIERNLNRKKGQKVESVKRKPIGPRPSHFVCYANNEPIQVRPLKFVNMF